MSFKETADCIEHQIVDKKTCQIHFDHIASVKAYMLDLFTEDEQRIVIETTHGIEYTFSEEEDGWEDFTRWLEAWAGLSADWWNEAYKKPFTKEVALLWHLTT